MDDCSSPFTWARIGTGAQSRRRYATAAEDSAQQAIPQSPYPYPAHPSPSAHQIFHLHRGATQSQIKARYYELVRCHHPDSNHCRRLPPHVAHARFQSIISAYDFLRGKSSSHIVGAKTYGWERGKSNFDPYLHELSRRRRAQQAAQADASWTDGFGAPRGSRSEDFRQDGIKERTIFIIGLLTLALGIYPSYFSSFHLDKTHNAAAINLTQARKDAREMGVERRLEIRKRVQDMQQPSIPGLKHPQGPSTREF